MANQELQEAKDIVNPEFVRNTKYVVKVTYVKDPGDFYARLCSLARIEEKFDNLPKNQLEKPKKLNINDLVFFTSTEKENKLLRGRISHFERDETFNIFAIDHGFEEQQVSKENIWKCDYSFEPLAFRCVLANIGSPSADGKWTQRAIDAMKRFIGSSISLMTYMGKTVDGRVIVKLHNYENDVGSLMILSNLAVFSTKASTDIVLI